MSADAKRVDFFVSFVVPEEVNEIVLTMKLEEILRATLGSPNIHVTKAFLGLHPDQQKELH